MFFMVVCELCKHMETDFIIVITLIIIIIYYHQERVYLAFMKFLEHFTPEVKSAENSSLLKILTNIHFLAFKF